MGGGALGGGALGGVYRHDVITFAYILFAAFEAEYIQD